MADLGHKVTGVDSSKDMLNQLTLTRGVLHQIKSLQLRETFDVVLLASTLINTVNAAERMQFLRVARAHVRASGAIVLERHAPTWRPAEGSESQLGPVLIRLSDVVWPSRAVLSACVVHKVDGHVARQAFSTQILDDAELDGCLIAAGFGPLRQISDDDRWVAATPEPAAPASD